jgi:hypothetical protein
MTGRPIILFGPARCQGCARRVWWGRANGVGSPTWLGKDGKAHECRETGPEATR